MEIEKEGNRFTIVLRDVRLVFEVDGHGYARPKIEISERELHGLFANMVRHLRGNLIMRKEGGEGWSHEFTRIIMREMIRLFGEVALASTKDADDRKNLSYFLTPTDQRALSAFLEAIKTEAPANPAHAAT